MPFYSTPKGNSPVLAGAGAPGAGLGNIGDLYFDTTAKAIYGPKTGSGWGSGTSLKGDQGDPGDPGPPGSGGSAAWGDITGKPTTFAPEGHAASHAFGGTDEVLLDASQVSTVQTEWLYLPQEHYDFLSQVMVALDDAIGIARGTSPYSPVRTYSPGETAVSGGRVYVKNAGGTGVPGAGTAWSLFLTKETVGLENVDNTSDEDKPLSIATQDALASKGARAFVVVGRDAADFICTGTLSTPTDHTVIQNAIDAVQAAGGGMVFLKPDVYYLGATINITAPNVRFGGAGRATELRAVGDYGRILNCALPTDPTSFPGLAGLVLENFRLESTVERTFGEAIYVKRSHNAVIRDIYLADLTYGVAYGLTTPVPPAFYDGVVLDGQDQCRIDNVVGCAVSRGIKVNGWDSPSADFAYDGLIANCKLWGSPGTKRGTAIEIGPNCGGIVLDFNSVNQWEYSLHAVYTGGQGGGVLTIRGGYAENDEHGYHIDGFQNVIVHDLWASLHTINCTRTIILGAAQPGSGNPSVEIESSGDSLECLVFGNADVTATGDGAAAVVIRNFRFDTVVFYDDPRLTDARAPTAHNHSAADITSGTLPVARLPGVPVYLQEATPSGSGWVHFKTNAGGDVIDIITG